MSDDNQKCCVIGGAGFIGGALVKKLEERFKSIIIVGRKDRMGSEFTDKCEYIKADILTFSDFTDIFSDCSEVYDLAYSSVPKTSYVNPIEDLQKNLPSAIGLLEAALEAKVKKFVFISSGGTVYGNSVKRMIVETDPTWPISPYGITKLAIEKYAMMFSLNKGLPIVIVRPGNAYGEGQRPFLGQGFIATAMAAILRNEKVKIFGETGTIRDYLHVCDVGVGISMAGQSAEPGQIYNLGSGVGRSNLDVIRAIEEVAALSGFRVKVEHVAARKFDVASNILDSKKLNVDTGWELAVSWREGISRTWHWMLKNSQLWENYNQGM